MELNERSVSISGTSNSPFGRVCGSDGSSMMYMPARPIQTLRPVTSIRWSWYHCMAPRSLPPDSLPV